VPARRGRAALRCGELDPVATSLTRTSTAAPPESVREPLPYSGSSERLKDFRVRVRSTFASNAAAGFMNRIQPKRSPLAM
jgi:hypothetical protein